MNKRIFILFGLLIFVLACNLPASASTQAPNLIATLQASTPLSAFTDTPPPSTVSAPTEPTGKIAVTCQLDKDISSEQICIVNADGSGYRRLTTDDNIRHFYPSISPDGQSVVYSAYNVWTKHYEIYELNISTNEVKELTFALGDLNAPEISPNGLTIVFTRFYNDPEKPTSWLINRDGSNPREISADRAIDPTWSPNGKQILFASYTNSLTQLFIINIDGTGLRQVSNLPALRGRSDWSPQDLIVTYSGKPWERELFAMKPDGSDQRQISPAGGNSQGPTFSPDGQWVAFTSYFDKYEVHGCEIYIMRVDGTDLRRLTDNDYCDYQPRWGP
jgi:Tol biopolymer transport system component